MKKILLYSGLASALLLQACGNPPLEAPKGTPYVKPTPSNWEQNQSQRQQAKAEYLQEHQVAYDWFKDFAFSETDGIPMIIFKLMPVIAPEFWGSEENFLSVVGLFEHYEKPNFPLPMGIGISTLTQSDPISQLDYTSFTCAACHIGRVRDNDGKLHYIEGGVNTEFNIVQYRVRAYKTINKIIGNETDQKKKDQLVIDAFSSALETTHASNPNYFYNNYQDASLKFDTAYEQAQIDVFKQTMDKTVPKFATDVVNQYTSYGALLNKNYDGIQARSLEGFPGMADATGISTTNAYSALQDNFFTRLFSNLILPPSPGITDFMSVWEQDKRKASWDTKHERLINGGGQWNGNIPIPMYRNLAAQLTLGLSDNDIRVSAFSVELLDGLPANPYPFDVDVELAKKGEKLFAENCAQCHQPHNGKVYDNLGTNLDRSYVVNWLVRKGGVDSFYSACNTDTTVMMQGKEAQPCAEFDGVSLKGKKQIIMSPNDEHHGYNARPLSGIWAQAPYLHNGSVPTLYHLLVPESRPEQFIKSRLDYDTQNVGFAWQASDNQKEGYLLDTRIFDTFSNKGHDTDILEDAKIYKLNWNDDKPGAMALVEYMKTL